MDVCSDCNIAYIGRKCPLCEATKEVEHLESVVAKLEKIIEELEETK